RLGLAPHGPGAVRSTPARAEEPSMRRLILPAVAALSLAFAPAPKPKPASNKADLKALQGVWELVRLNQEGIETRLPSGGYLVTVSGARVRYAQGGRQASEWSITLDATKDPKHINFRSAAGKVLPGIYRLDKDRWTVCCNTIGDGKRPTAFKTGKGQSMEVLHRKKP